MKNLILIYTLFFVCQEVFSQTTSYYGHDMLMAVREEAPDKKCNTIQLAGGIIIKDCDNATTEYAINDHLGSTRTIVDDKLANKLSCDYDAYGNISNDVPLELRDKCRYVKTYKWSNTAQMYYSPTRAYQPIAKRFLSTDMMKVNFSTYLYANSNPIRFNDRYGMAPRSYRMVYKHGLYTDLSPEQEKLMGHPDLPPIRQNPDGSSSRFTLDADSYATLKQIKRGNAFVGILNYTTGNIYLSPVERREEGAFWQGTNFEGEIRIMGKTYPQIVHNEISPISGTAITAHRQLVQRIDESLGNIPEGMDPEDYFLTTDHSRKYLGFGIRSDKGMKMVFRSRGLNNSHMHREINVADADAALYKEKFEEFLSNTCNVGIDDVERIDAKKKEKVRKIFEDYIEKNTGLRIYESYKEESALGNPEEKFEEMVSRATYKPKGVDNGILYDRQFVYDEGFMETVGGLNKSYFNALLDFFSKLDGVPNL